MKKYLYIVLLFITTNAFSQAPIGVYIRAGLSQTSLDSKDLLTKSSPGFMAGLNFNLGYHESYNFQFEATFNQNILNLKTIDGTYTNISESKYKYSSVEVGAFVNYYILKPEEDKFFIGPQVGFFGAIVDEISPAKSADVFGELYLPYLLTESSLDFTSEFNYGVGLGLTGGYNDFRFDLRYSLGLKNMLKEVTVDGFGTRDDNNLYIGPNLEAKTRGITFGISYNL